MSLQEKIKQSESALRELPLRQDLIAGLTVSVVGISSSMAYAAIAGVNPIYGLYAAIVPAIIGGLFGSSKVLITGPTNATALVTASILIGLGVGDDKFLDMVFALAILSGLIRLLFGILNLGSILRFVSASVLAGFMAAVGILIAFGQLGNLTGIIIPKNDGLIVIISRFFRGLGQANLWVVGVGGLSILLMVVLKKKFPRLPTAFLTIVFVSLAVEVFGLHPLGIRQVCDLNLPEHPSLNFYLPKVNLDDVVDLLPGAAALALFTLVEALSTAKAFSDSAGRPMNVSREFRAQGLASMAGGFFMAIPSSGSPSRSAVNYMSGAKSRMSAVFSGIFLFLILILFSKWISYIALPSLAAAILVSGLSLVDFRQIHIVWNARIASKIVFLGTFLATLFLPLHLSIYIGVGISILLHMVENSEVHMTYMMPTEDGGIVEKELDELYRDLPDIAVINIQGDLYFSLVDNLEKKLRMVINQNIKFVVLRFRRVNVVGSTGIVALKKLISYANKKNVKIIICGLQPEVRENLEMAGIKDLVGDGCLLNAGEKIYDSMFQAISCAEEQLAEEII